MAPRKRSKNNPDVPNLKVHKRGKDTYYGWSNPNTGKESSLDAKNDRQTAITRAKELNKIIALEKSEATINRVLKRTKPKTQSDGATFNQFMPIYLDLMETKENLAPSTMRNRKAQCNAFAKKHGDMPLMDITIAEIDEVLSEHEDAGQGAMAQAIRRTLKSLIETARQKGVIDVAHPNMAEHTRKPKSVVKRARLTLDEWLKIRHTAKTAPPWVGISMDLALVTGLRVSDISIMQYRKGRDWPAKWTAWQKAHIKRTYVPLEQHPYAFIENDLLHIVSFKGKGTLLQLPLDLCQEATQLKLGDVIKASRSRFLSRWVVHHNRPAGNMFPGNPVTWQALSVRFKKTRDQTNLVWENRTPPSFHEQRSLAERLYKKQGVDTQSLLGHRDAKMTQIYDDPRGAEWTLITI